jgi:membrane-bound ClpP family serine protease
MSLYAIILLIILGVILLWVEFLVVPGITVAGIGGVLLIGTGIYLSYNLYGTAAGTIIKPGDTGKTVTRLAPIGRVEVNGVYYEAKSTDNIINSETDVTVVKVLNDKLIVKPTNLE